MIMNKLLEGAFRIHISIRCQIGTLKYRIPALYFASKFSLQWIVWTWIRRRFTSSDRFGGILEINGINSQYIFLL